MFSVGPNTADVHFHLLVKVASASFFHCKAPLFPSVIKKYFCGSVLWNHVYILFLLRFLIYSFIYVRLMVSCGVTIILGSCVLCLVHPWS